MHNAPYWFTRLPPSSLLPLRGKTDADTAIVGGGISGLSAAQWLREEAGRDVVLVEGSFCGAGATGRSSGFITPDSETELSQLARRFGDADAAMLWRAGVGACALIRANIARSAIDCDLVEADSLYVANSPRGVAAVRAEHEAHRRLGFSSRFYSRAEMGEALGADGFHAGLRAPGTFGVSGAAYARALRDTLIARGVRIHEGSPAGEVGPGLVRTPEGEVRARHVIVCLDRFAPDLDIARRDTYHAQTFLILSEPLADATRRALFPAGPMLVWDTDLTYQYHRLTAEGRLLVGGGLIRNTYARRESPVDAGVRHLLRYIRAKYPVLNTVRFTHAWPGLIGLSKDLLPLAGPYPCSSSQTGSRDAPGADRGEPTQHVAMCGAGLPWSTLAGRVAAQRAVGGATPLDRFFDPGRAFSTIEPLQPFVGKPATWALSYYIAKNLETGSSDRVRARQGRVRAAMLLAAGLAGLGIGYGATRGARRGR